MNGYYLIVYREKPPPWKAGKASYGVTFFDTDNYHKMTELLQRDLEEKEHRVYEIAAKYILAFQFKKDFPPEIYCRVGKEIWDLNHPVWQGWITPEFIQESLDKVILASVSFA